MLRDITNVSLINQGGRGRVKLLQNGFTRGT